MPLPAAAPCCLPWMRCLFSVMTGLRGRRRKKRAVAGRVNSQGSPLRVQRVLAGPELAWWKSKWQQHMQPLLYSYMAQRTATYFSFSLSFLGKQRQYWFKALAFSGSQFSKVAPYKAVSYPFPARLFPDQPPEQNLLLVSYGARSRLQFNWALWVCFIPTLEEEWLKSPNYSLCLCDYYLIIYSHPKHTSN